MPESIIGFPSGVRIRLQEQPLQVLTVLLQHPGGVVTREELRSEIWTAERPTPRGLPVLSNLGKADGRF